MAPTGNNRQGIALKRLVRATHVKYQHLSINANYTSKKEHIADLKNANEQFSFGFVESKNANQSYFI